MYISRGDKAIEDAARGISMAKGIHFVRVVEMDLNPDGFIICSVIDTWTNQLFRGVIFCGFGTDSAVLISRIEPDQLCLMFSTISLNYCIPVVPVTTATSCGYSENEGSGLAFDGIQFDGGGSFIGIVTFSDVDGNDQKGMLITASSVNNMHNWNSVGYPHSLVLNNRVQHLINDKLGIISFQERTQLENHFVSFLEGHSIFTPGTCSFLHEYSKVDNFNRKFTTEKRYSLLCGISYQKADDDFHANSVNLITEKAADFARGNVRTRIFKPSSSHFVSFTEMTKKDEAETIKYGFSDVLGETGNSTQDFDSEKDTSEIANIADKEFYVVGKTSKNQEFEVRINFEKIILQTKGTSGMKTSFSIDIESGELTVNAMSIILDPTVALKLSGSGSSIPVNNLPVCPFTGAPHGTNPKVLV